jgi:2-polyprenyl-3-methyl-5-hydroxy-6-metoxy-1,4-benzoquinol methylase
MLPEIIDGIPCYAPELAFDNSGFHPEAQAMTANVERNHFWYKSRNEILKKIIQKSLKGNPTNFLEVGCGNGTVLYALSALKNLHLTGADIYLSGVKFAKSLLPSIDFIQINAENIPFENKFDAIGCFDVLEHIENDEKVLSQLHKALKKNSHLFISVPQYPWLWCDIDDMDRHKRRYTRFELVEKVKKSGFKITYVNCFVFALFPLMMTTRLIRRMKNKKINYDTVEYPELKISPFINAVLRIIMKIDELCYSLNLKLPFGGSILLVATKE